ncbi:hypothetical protein M231_01077 [Tremella mesenterica]|uniref:Uncharacterized protein n=1 Tax=Tremella mesenterica TaxID=5217 RepID=A0A4Q1BU79_TREME|nr:hypothetical protein M231_01077 [Tremella mesenterica]
MILISSIYDPPLTPPLSPPSVPRLRRLFSRDDTKLYILPVPNLELHSAAASGNVGLVHYALTHGQPVNSVLHGVLPLHAACSGGSATVVRMLIERGADVNAPRLPRRYSDGKRSNVPSVGTAGSTPLHFAAANGHANIVQILLTCGAVPDKTDKNGMTPEALAEINGHTGVIRVIRVWEHLKLQEKESQSVESSNSPSVIKPIAGPSSDAAEVGSIGVSELEETKSEKAVSVRDRRLSNVSGGTDKDRILNMKKSLSSLFKRGKKNSVSSVDSKSIHSVIGSPTNFKKLTDQSSPPATQKTEQTEEIEDGKEVDDDRTHSISPPEIDIGDDASEISWHDADDGSGALGLGLPNQQQPSSITQSRSTMFSDVQATLHDNESAIELGSPASATSILAPPASPLSRAASGDEPNPKALNRTPSGASANSQVSAEHLTPPTQIHRRARGSSSASHRPSLPSILEKASHPAATLRAAIHRTQHPAGPSSPPHTDDSISTSPTSPISPISPTGPHFFRGRKSSSQDAHPHYTKKYLNAHVLTQLFHRSNSPPSRSPSPPERTDSSKMIEGGELDEGIERLRAASMDLDKRHSTASSGNFPLSSTLHPMPVSAPAVKTRFFENLDAPDLPHIDLSAYRQYRPKTPPPLSASSSTSEPPWSRTRNASEVLVPSPLAKEWQRRTSGSESDSQSSPLPTIRRARTEVARSPTSPSPRKGGSGPLSPLGFGIPVEEANVRSTKRRSATLPSVSVGRAQGGGWDEGGDLRRVAASGSIRRRSERLLAQANQDSGRDDEDWRRSEAAENEYQDALLEQAALLDQLSISSDTSSTMDRPMRSDPLVNEDSPEQVVKPEALSVEVERSDPTVGGETSNDTDEEKTPEATPGLEQTTIDLAPLSISPRKTGRYRGGSIGSQNTDSSRFSGTSSLRMTSLPSQSPERSPDSSTPEVKFTYPIPRYPSVNPNVCVTNEINTRTRGKSISSISSTTSGLGVHSTPSSSLTPPSILSAVGAGFPPVPEDAVAHHPPSRRAISTSAEAHDLVKQHEDSILQLAQLPLSRDSTRNLAAQLAAYGENHAIEQQLVEAERRSRSGSNGSASASGSFDRFGIIGREDKVESRRRRNLSPGSSLSSGSFHSAHSVQSAPSALSNNSRSSGRASLQKTAVTRAGQKSFINPLSSSSGMISGEGGVSMSSLLSDTSNIPGINSIYDRRAAAYKDRMAALTLPPTQNPVQRARAKSALAGQGPKEIWLSGSTHSGPSSSTSPPNRTSMSSPLPTSFNNSQTPIKEGLLRIEEDRHPFISSPMPLIHPTTTKKKRTPPRTNQSARYTLSNSGQKTPAPIAEVVSARYQGQNIRHQGYGGVGMGTLSPVGSVGFGNVAVGGVGATGVGGLASVGITGVGGLASVGITGVGGGRNGEGGTKQLSLSPHVSTFSTRYTRGPHDDVDSDDSESEPRGYTVIENDWRGGHVVRPEGMKKRWMGIGKKK